MGREFGLNLGEEFAVPAGLLPGELAVFTADGTVSIVFVFRGSQFVLNASDGGGEILLVEFTFPDGDDGPGEGVEALGVEFVAGNVAGDLVFPEVGVGFWRDILGTAAVTVPEAAVDEDDCPVFRQYKVRRTGQSLVVEPVAITSAPEFVPHDPFWSRVAGMDAGHAVVPL